MVSLHSEIHHGQQLAGHQLKSFLDNQSAIHCRNQDNTCCPSYDIKPRSLTLKKKKERSGTLTELAPWQNYRCSNHARQ
jgi:hypothetical protein